MRPLCSASATLWDGVASCLRLARGSKSLSLLAQAAVVAAAHSLQRHMQMQCDLSHVDMCHASWPCSTAHSSCLCCLTHRVEAAGGRVEPKRLPSGRMVGEPRVWLQHLPSPGLMLSRSIGDGMASSVGCTAQPEVISLALRPGADAFLVVASDGVWDVLGNDAGGEGICFWGVVGCSRLRGAVCAWWRRGLWLAACTNCSSRARVLSHTSFPHQLPHQLWGCSVKPPLRHAQMHTLARTPIIYLVTCALTNTAFPCRCACRMWCVAVCEIVSHAEDPAVACSCVLEAALAEWAGRLAADNISVIVCKFEWE